MDGIDGDVLTDDNDMTTFTAIGGVMHVRVAHDRQMATTNDKIQRKPSLKRPGLSLFISA
jgi:hypothetical protein